MSPSGLNASVTFANNQMFNINSLTLINFRSYKGTHRFEFPSANGLYYLTGQNLLTPSLGANGAGKSTFLDAITWVLYGRTSRGLKAADVLTWHGKVGAQVIIDITVGTERFEIKRSQKPNVLTIDGKAVDQKELETFIRLNYAGFTHSILSPQFGVSFFSLPAEKKLSLFSDFLKLDFWLHKAEQATLLARQQSATLAKLKLNIARDEAQLAMLEEEIPSLEKQSKEFAAVSEKKVRDLEDEHVEVYKKRNKLVRSMERLDAEAMTLEGNTKVFKSYRDNCEAAVDAILAAVQNWSTKIHDIKLSITTEESALKKLTGLGEGDCPHCEQPLEEHSIREAITFHKGRLQGFNASLASKTKAHQGMMAELVKAKGQLAAREQQYEEAKNALDEVDANIARKEAEAQSADKLLRDLKRRMEEIEQTTNPYKALLDNKRQRADLLRNSVAELHDEAERLAGVQGATEFWSKAFKRIRLFIIEQAFQTLELEVNNCLAQLGMPDWQVTFAIERENKSGGLTRGFIVLIKGPSNKEPVKWENWSGGETQRLQLAGDLGLSNLIMQQAGLRSEVEFYDEPSTHLSPEGMMDLADTLHDRAVNEGKRIWIADHAAISSFGAFEGIIIARKDENGSSITSR